MKTLKLTSIAILLTGALSTSAIASPPNRAIERVTGDLQRYRVEVYEQERSHQRGRDEASYRSKYRPSHHRDYYARHHRDDRPSHHYHDGHKSKGWKGHHEAPRYGYRSDHHGHDRWRNAPSHRHGGFGHRPTQYEVRVSNPPKQVVHHVIEREPAPKHEHVVVHSGGKHKRNDDGAMVVGAVAGGILGNAATEGKDKVGGTIAGAIIGATVAKVLTHH